MNILIVESTLSDIELGVGKSGARGCDTHCDSLLTILVFGNAGVIELQVVAI
jgi:hypothetical protein